MKLARLIPTVALAVVLSVVSLAGKKTPPAPHLFVYDIKAQNWVPLAAPDGAQIYVAGPSGYQPGVLAAVGDDKKAILILPPELIPVEEAPEPPTHPEVQPQTDRERLDHAQVLRTSR
jgi:hypothetical protein